jgi:hypothetical protein
LNGRIRSRKEQTNKQTNKITTQIVQEKMLHNFELHKCKKPINPNFGNQIKIKEMKNKNKNKVERRLE